MLWLALKTLVQEKGRRTITLFGEVATGQYRVTPAKMQGVVIAGAMRTVSIVAIACLPLYWLQFPLT